MYGSFIFIASQIQCTAVVVFITASTSRRRCIQLNQFNGEHFKAFHDSKNIVEAQHLHRLNRVFIIFCLYSS